jgi:hypothetical protein
MKKLIVLLRCSRSCPSSSLPTQTPSRCAARQPAGREDQLPTQNSRDQYNDFAAYGDPVDGPNKANTYDTASPTSTSTDNPDSLTELGATTGLDWGFPITGFPAPPPDYFVLAIRANANNVPYPGCAAKFGPQTKPSWWPRSARLMHLRQLARAQ